MGWSGSGRVRVGFVAAAVALLAGVGGPFALQGLGIRAALATGSAGTCTQTTNTVGACSTKASTAGSITGTVTDAAGTGVPGICVHIYPGGGNFTNLNDATTDSTGNYTIGALPAGGYDVEFTGGCGNAGSVAPQWYHGAATEAASTPVHVTVGKYSSGVDATVSTTSGGSITGTVKSSSGAGIAGVCVYAYLPGATRYGALAHATTISGGAYTVANLASGSYDVSVDPSCQGTASAPYAVWYYDGSATGTPQSSGATPLTVIAGSATPLEAVLEAGSSIGNGTATISGTVTDAAGTGVSGACVDAYLAGSTILVTTSATSTKTGTYSLSHLAAGSYQVEFEPTCGSNPTPTYGTRWYDVTSGGGATSQSGATPIVISSSKQVHTGVDAKLATAKFGTVSGTVTGTSAGTGPVCVLLHTPGGGTSPYSATVSLSASSPYDAAYSITGVLTGSYDVEFDPTCHGRQPSTPYVIQWYDGTVGGAAFQPGAKPVTVTTGATTTVTATLGTPPGTISGTLTVPSALTRFGPTASVYPAGSTTSAVSASLTGTGTARTYQVGGLPAGSYDVEFHASSSSGSSVTEWYNGTSSPATTRATATAVVISPAHETYTGVDGGFGDISGTVTQPTGDTNPIIVSAFLPGSDRVLRSTATVAGSASPQSYSFGLLPEGSYDVEFLDYGTAHLGTQWYDGASTRSAATAINDTTSTAASSVDATMAPAGAATSGSISGDVTGAGGSGSYEICVDAYPSGTSPSSTFSTQSFPSGSGPNYTVGGLPVGSYDVEFDPSCGGRYDPGYPTQWYDANATTTGDVTTIQATATSLAISSTLEAYTTINDALPSPAGSSTALTVTTTGSHVYGQSVTYHAKVTGSGATPTGSVTFSAGSTTLCADVTLSSGTATCTTSATPVGTTETVTATYSGSAAYGASSGSASVTVGQASTTTTLTASSTTPSVDAKVTYTATVSVTSPGSGTPGGKVVFDGTSSAISCTPGGSGGQTLATVSGKVTATCTVTYTSPGSHSITATYQGSTDFSASPVSSAVTVKVGTSSTTSLTVTTTGSHVYGQSITYHAKVTGSGATPAGSVTFSAGSTTLCSGVTLVTGAATCTTTATPVGTTETVTATYSGSTVYGGSTGTATVTVAKATTTTTVSSAATSVVYGQSVTYTVTVAPEHVGIPTGKVTVSVGGTSVCTVTLVASGAGKGSCSSSTAPFGSAQTISARYAGDANFSTSSGSAATHLTVGQASTATSVKASTVAPAVGQPVTYTATVSVTSPGSGTPTGTVVFDGTSSAISCTGGDQTLATVSGKATATCTVSYPSTGTHSVTAAYQGSTDFSASPASSALSVRVGKAATATSVKASTVAPAVGQPVTYTATVSVTSPGSGTPTGTVVFDGTSSAISCTGGDQTLATVSGKATATCTVSYPSTGTHSVTAAYQGSTDFSASPASSALGVKVAPASTTTSEKVTTAGTLTYGEPVTYSATVGVVGPGSGVPTGTVTFSVGSTVLCSGVALATGKATCTSSAAPAGPDTVTAAYGGTPSFSASSGKASVTVNVVPPAAPSGSTGSSSSASASPSGTATATHGGATASGSGVGALTVASYSGNPTTGALSTATGAYYDVAIGAGSTFTSVTITICNPGAGHSLLWWNGSAWAQFSDQSEVTGCLVAVVTSATSPTVAELVGTPVAVSTAASGNVATGYWEVARDGGIFSFGTASFYGSMGGKPLNAPIVGVAATPTGKGYWEVASDGGIFSFGTASFYGSMGGKALNAPIVGIAATPTGKGYWEVARDGGIFSFGTASFYGSMGGKTLNAPIVGIAATPTGKGYWEVASDGGIFSFGTASFYGSMGGKTLNAPIVGIAATPTGKGYWEVASDGGIFSFGTASFYGSMGGKTLNAPIVGIAATPTGKGYWEVASDGGIFSFGTASFYGSMGGKPLNAPIVGLAAG